MPGRNGKDDGGPGTEDGRPETGDRKGKGKGILARRRGGAEKGNVKDTSPPPLSS